MSKKKDSRLSIIDDTLWVPSVDHPEYCYPTSNLYDRAYAIESNLLNSINFHPEWVRLMNQLEIGDLVTNENGEIGIIVAEIEEATALKRFEVSFKGRREKTYSVFLKKVNK